MKIGFIGAGNMALAMVSGILESGVCKKEDIYVCDVSPAAVDKALSFGVNVAKQNTELVNKTDYIFLTVKPMYYEAVIGEIRDSADDTKTIITVTPGKTHEWLLSAFLKDIPIVRTMPNTPAMVGEGMTAVCPNKLVKEDKLNAVLCILRSFGKAEIITENLFDAVTAVSGSSPAYVFMFIEAMADAAVKEGMTRSTAYSFAAQAVLGSAKMVLETGMHPGELKDMVCSPGGTTIEAVNTLKQNGFEGNVIEAMKACAEKSRKMQS